VYDPRRIDPFQAHLSIPLLPPGAIRHISQDTAIPTSTLSDWRRKRTDPSTPDWVPLAQGHPAKRARAETAEEAIADAIRTNDIQSGKGVTREIAATLAMNAYASLPVDEIRSERFTTSSRFIDGFLNGHHLVLLSESPHLAGHAMSCWFGMGSPSVTRYHQGVDRDAF
jgi:hypothetical protein